MGTQTIHPRRQLGASQGLDGQSAARFTGTHRRKTVMFSSFRPHIRLTLGALALTAGAVTLTGSLPASAGTLGVFACIDHSGGAASAAATVSALRIAHHDGYDRLVIDFATSNTMPQYQLTQQATSHFVRDASGQPVTLDGTAGLRLVLRNADITPRVPNDLKPELPAIREVAQIGNFERVVSYGVGLATPACFRVLELSGPTRLVMDYRTPVYWPPATAAPTAAPSTAPPATVALPAAPSTAAPSTTPSKPAAPSDLASTGHPSPPAQPASSPVFAVILGLLVLTAGLTIAGIR